MSGEVSTLKISSQNSLAVAQFIWQLSYPQDLTLDQLLGAGSKAPESDDSDVPTEKLERMRDGRPCPQLDCVCYGLGSFSSSVSSRYQLAMLLLLLDARQVRGHFYVLM